MTGRCSHRLGVLQRAGRDHRVRRARRPDFGRDRSIVVVGKHSNGNGPHVPRPHDAYRAHPSAQSGACLGQSTQNRLYTMITHMPTATLASNHRKIVVAQQGKLYPRSRDAPRAGVRSTYADRIVYGRFGGRMNTGSGRPIRSRISRERRRISSLAYAARSNSRTRSSLGTNRGSLTGTASKSSMAEITSVRVTVVVIVRPSSGFGAIERGFRHISPTHCGTRNTTGRRVVRQGCDTRMARSRTIRRTADCIQPGHRPGDCADGTPKKKSDRHRHQAPA